MGVEEPPIVCMFTTIQNLHHYIRTVYGDVALRMQQALDLSEGGIRATGSAIVPEKSHWYLIALKSGSKEIGDTSRRLKLRHTSVSAIAMAM